MNILYYYSSQQIHTGSPKVLLRLIGGLDRKRHVPFYFEEKGGPLSDSIKQLSVNIIKSVNKQISKENIFENIKNIYSLIKILKQHSIDLLHVNELGWNYELVLAAWLSRIPIIFHIHNLETITRLNLNCLLGSGYLFVSQKLASQCDPTGKLNGKSHILYNPINIDEYKSGRSIRSDLGLPHNNIIIGTVAQISKRKGIDIILDVAEMVLLRSKNTKFVIVGPDAIGEESYANEMRRRVLEKGLSEQIIFLGPRDDVADILASIDIFFLPTRSEPFGMVFVEAMAAGVPVVASNVGGIPEIIPTDEFGVLLDSEYDGYLKVLLELIYNVDKREMISDKAFIRAKDTFSDNIFNLNVEALYTKINLK